VDEYFTHHAQNLKFLFNLHKNALRENTIMKTMAIFLVLFFLVGCEFFPSNPQDKVQNLETVYIEHCKTDYVSTEPPMDGVVATKVNVLTFQMRVKNFKPRALEFYGRAILDGPPESREHALCFRTDSVSLIPKDTGYIFNKLEEIDSESTYTLIRPKFPTNEYSPFCGTQGKVLKITITEVWAFNENYERFSVAFVDSV